tara:strand:- start:7974 stop:8750 length:777 start_codon:yes stop_codon:yes gene_type:complete
MKRIIPVLLVQDGGLVKSVNFRKHNYIGDPINAVKIFNEKEVDEIVILDISASKENRSPNIGMIREIASEAFMPLAYGGGITTIEEVKDILFQGVEKVVFNTLALNKPTIIAQTASRFGSSSTVVSIDVKKNIFGKWKIYSHLTNKSLNIDIAEYAKQMQDLGAGELFLNSVDQDGTFKGFDLKLISKVSNAVQIPVIACGGAANPNDLAYAIVMGGASASAAGSMFVYQNSNRAVLINYPEWENMQKIIEIIKRNGH